jgi:hypothetical protein
MIRVIAAARIVDGAGSLAETSALEQRIERAGMKAVRVEVAAMRHGWNQPLPDHVIKCACAPLIAIERHRDALTSGALDALIVYGKDHVRSEFEGRTVERNRLFQVYQGKTFLDGYQRLGELLLARWGIDRASFLRLAEQLYANYARTWERKTGAPPRIDPRWLANVSGLYRGVDCANPNTDFEGCVILASDVAADRLQVPPEARVEVAGCSVQVGGADGIDAAAAYIDFAHLTRAYEAVCRQAGADFVAEFLRGRALLETYTCYPVVPLAFLLSTGMVGGIDQLGEFLERHEITITGGLNLARAPANNTTLSALVEVVAELRDRRRPGLAGVHSVCALGYQQAFALLRR